jgi:hypothetical protein
MQDPGHSGPPEPDPAGRVRLNAIYRRLDLPNNTIIIPFRHTAHLPLCLTGLEVCGDVDQHHIILAQHGGTQYDFQRDDLHLTHWFIPENTPFHLAKLLNGAVKRARTEWVTILSPDVLVPSDFIARIEDFQANRHIHRVYFPVRYLDSTATLCVELRFNSFYERIVPNKTWWRRGGETFKSFLIGSDCFSVRTARYLETGGYDEQFHDRTLAGLDFGCRWLNSFGPPACADCHLFHRWGRIGSLDENPAPDAHESSLFAEKQKLGFPPLPITREWGVFEHKEI